MRKPWPSPRRAVGVAEMRLPLNSVATGRLSPRRVEGNPVVEATRLGHTVPSSAREPLTKSPARDPGGRGPARADCALQTARFSKPLISF